MSLKELEEKRESLLDMIVVTESEIYRVQMSTIAGYFKQSEDTLPSIAIGSWECKDSPIGVCFYDSREDPAYDDCLICSEPHERK